MRLKDDRKQRGDVIKGQLPPVAVKKAVEERRERFSAQRGRRLEPHSRQQEGKRGRESQAVPQPRAQSSEPRLLGTMAEPVQHNHAPHARCKCVKSARSCYTGPFGSFFKTSKELVAGDNEPSLYIISPNSRRKEKKKRENEEILGLNPLTEPDCSQGKCLRV